jgi:hypothetical protein
MLTKEVVHNTNTNNSTITFDELEKIFSPFEIVILIDPMVRSSDLVTIEYEGEVTIKAFHIICIHTNLSFLTLFITGFL